MCDKNDIKIKSSTMSTVPPGVPPSPLRFLLLVPGHGDPGRFPYLKGSIEAIQKSFFDSLYFSARALSCVIYTYTTRSVYDLERRVYHAGDESTKSSWRAVNGTGIQNCEVVREVGLHYQQALYDAYERSSSLYKKAVNEDISYENGLFWSHDLEEVEEQEPRRHPEVVGGVASLLAKEREGEEQLHVHHSLHDLRKTTTHETTRPDRNNNIFKHDYVLVLLDDVQVVRFDPDVFFPLMWHNELSVAQPHTLCSGSAVFEEDQFVRGLQQHWIPGWVTRTFELQFTVFSRSAFACLNEELLHSSSRTVLGFPSEDIDANIKDVEVVYRGFEKLFFWVCGGRLSREAMANREYFWRAVDNLGTTADVEVDDSGVDDKIETDQHGAFFVYDTLRKKQEQILDSPMGYRHYGGASISMIRGFFANTVHPAYLEHIGETTTSTSTTASTNRPRPTLNGINTGSSKKDSSSQAAVHAQEFRREILNRHFFSSERRGLPSYEFVDVHNQPFPPSDYDSEIVYPLGFVWYRALALHLVWAVPQGTLYLLGSTSSCSSSSCKTVEDKGIFSDHMDNNINIARKQAGERSETRRQQIWAMEKWLEWRADIVDQIASSQCEIQQQLRKEFSSSGTGTGSDHDNFVEDSHWFNGILLSAKQPVCLSDKYRFMLHQMQRLNGPQSTVREIFAENSRALFSQVRQEERLAVKLQQTKNDEIPPVPQESKNIRSSSDESRSSVDVHLQGRRENEIEMTKALPEREDRRENKNVEIDEHEKIAEDGSGVGSENRVDTEVILDLVRSSTPRILLTRAREVSSSSPRTHINRGSPGGSTSEELKNYGADVHVDSSKNINEGIYPSAISTRQHPDPLVQEDQREEFFSSRHMQLLELNKHRGRGPHSTINKSFSRGPVDGHDLHILDFENTAESHDVVRRGVAERTAAAIISKKRRQRRSILQSLAHACDSEKRRQTTNDVLLTVEQKQGFGTRDEDGTSNSIDSSPRRVAAFLLRGALQFGCAFTSGLTAASDSIHPLQSLGKTKYLLHLNFLEDAHIHLSTLQKRRLLKDFLQEDDAATPYKSVQVQDLRHGTEKDLQDVHISDNVDYDREVSSLSRAEVLQRMLREDYHFSRALKFDPRGVAYYNLGAARNTKRNPDHPFQNIVTKDFSVGEISRLVRGGRLMNGERFLQPIDLQTDFTYLHYSDWLAGLNEYSLFKILECNLANIVAAGNQNQHWGYDVYKSWNATAG